jgi:hypothetical protein
MRDTDADASIDAASQQGVDDAKSVHVQPQRRAEPVDDVGVVARSKNDLGEQRCVLGASRDGQPRVRRHRLRDAVPRGRALLRNHGEKNTTEHSRDQNGC